MKSILSMVRNSKIIRSSQLDNVRDILRRCLKNEVLLHPNRIADSMSGNSMFPILVTFPLGTLLFPLALRCIIMQLNLQNLSVLTGPGQRVSWSVAQVCRMVHRSVTRAGKRRYR